jgi:hypothetical protein
MGRKQVSSHMQVVKKFFEDLRCCKALRHTLASLTYY